MISRGAAIERPKKFSSLSGLWQILWEWCIDTLISKGFFLYL
jgi:hypothetical protein